jgi:hypothetical protein
MLEDARGERYDRWIIANGQQFDGGGFALLPARRLLL